MFQRRDLGGELAAVRDEHAPDAFVFDTERDFETLSPAVAENLAPIVDSFEPLSYPDEWVPTSAPEPLRRLASDEFTIGAPGDGGVAWTRQTVPPTVFVKPRLEGSPDGFVEFLIAEAFVEIGLDHPEQFLGFFGERYRELAEATPLDPAETYQLAAALFDAYVGLEARELFAAWEGTHGRLHAEWVDAGERLAPRVSGLPRDVAVGRTDFASAAELACSAVKHGLELPAPFAALDTSAYRDHGAAYAVRWAERTFEALAD